MDDILQTNTFFFITGVASIVIAVFLSLALWRLMRVLKMIEKISEIVEQELYIFRDDVADARTFVRHEGIKFRHALGFLSMLFTIGDKVNGRREKLGRKLKHTVHTEETNGKQ